MMCMVSNIGDSWKNQHIQWEPYIQPGTGILSNPTRQEFNKLKAEVESLKKLLEAAKKYDEETNQPDCEMDEKVDFIKKIAEYVGVDLESVFGKDK